MVAEAKILDSKIIELQDKKSEYDFLAYVLYGTGPDLENAVAFLLKKLGLDVEHTVPGANIDLTANHPELNLGFGVEVTGITGTIGKDSSKSSQAWQYSTTPYLASIMRGASGVSNSIVKLTASVSSLASNLVG